MKKIRDLRLLIGAAAIATAGTSAAFAIVAATTSAGVQADPICEGVWLNGKTVVDKCIDIGTGNKCVNTGVSPQLAVEVCVPF